MTDNIGQNSLPEDTESGAGAFFDPDGQTKSHPDLYKKTLKGGFWLFSGRLYQQSLGFLRMVILLKFLAPREFGVIGISMLVMQILEIFTQTGFVSALVQKKQDNVHDFLNTAWTTNLIRGFVLFAILYIVAPFAVTFFDGNGTFKPTDFNQPVQLALRLQNDADELSLFIRSTTDEKTKEHLRQALQNQPESDKSAIKTILADVFNTVVSRKESLYTPQRFKKINLSDYAQSQVAAGDSASMPRTNRLLLEQAWPDLINSSILNLPQVTLIIRLMGLLLIIRAFVNVATLYFTKHLKFHKQFLFQLIGSTAGVMVTVVLAVWLRNVWALVWGTILMELISLVVSYCLEPYCPRLELKWDKLRQMWRFGRWISGLTILDFFLGKIDSLFVSRLSGVTSLGLYQWAGTVANLPATEIANVINAVAFPAYCKIQSELERLRQAFFKSSELIITAALPWLVFIISVGGDAVRLFLTNADGQNNWIPMIPAMQLLGVWGIFRVTGTGGGAVIQALGKPHYLTVLSSLRLAVMIGLMAPLVNRYGITGAAGAVLLSHVLMLLPGYTMACYLLKCGLYRILSCQLPGFLAAVVSIGVILTIKSRLWTDQSIWRLAVLAVLGILIYFGLCLKLSAMMGGSINAMLGHYWKAAKERIKTRR